MKDFEKQMKSWRNECKSRATIQPTENAEGVVVTQGIDIDQPEVYDPLPEETTEVEPLTKIEAPKF